VRFPFSDLAATKLRPALVVAAHGEDFIVMGIFSRVSGRTVRRTWVQIDEHQAGFRRTGLKKTSLLKAEKIAVVRRSVLQRELGAMGADLLAQMQAALKRALLLS